MTEKEFNEALNNIDVDIVETYLRKKAQNQNITRKPMRWAKWCAVAACFAILVIGATLLQYIPKNYNLEYIYTDKDGKEVYTAIENVWIYYMNEHGYSARERVSLPANPQNLFLTWKYLNNIGENVTLLKCQITSNGVEHEITYDGQTVKNYQMGEHYVLNIVVSSNIAEYIPETQYDATVASLIKTFTNYSNIVFDEVNFIAE